MYPTIFGQNQVMKAQQKPNNGSVGIKSFQGRLRLRLPRQLDGGKQKYLTLGLDDTQEHRQIAEVKAQQIESDIANECFDPTLAKYRPQTHLTLLQFVEEPQKVDTISELWDRYIEHKRQSLKPRTLDKLAVLEKQIKPCPYQSFDQALTLPAAIAEGILSSPSKLALPGLPQVE